MSRALRQYHALLRDQGCIITGRPPHLHHPRFAAGLGQKASDWLVIPLAPEHHNQGGPGVAIHAGEKEFERVYGSEEKLLGQTIERALTNLLLRR